MRNIQIRLERGIIQPIDGLPPEIAVEVLDYDVDKRNAFHRRKRPPL